MRLEIAGPTKVAVAGPVGVGWRVDPPAICGLIVDLAAFAAAHPDVAFRRSPKLADAFPDALETAGYFAFFHFASASSAYSFVVDVDGVGPDGAFGYVVPGPDFDALPPGVEAVSDPLAAIARLGLPPPPVGAEVPYESVTELAVSYCTIDCAADPDFLARMTRLRSLKLEYTGYHAGVAPSRVPPQLETLSLCDRACDRCFAAPLDAALAPAAAGLVELEATGSFGDDLGEFLRRASALRGLRVNAFGGGALRAVAHAPVDLRVLEVTSEWGLGEQGLDDASRAAVEERIGLLGGLTRLVLRADILPVYAELTTIVWPEYPLLRHLELDGHPGDDDDDDDSDTESLFANFAWSVKTRSPGAVVIVGERML